MSRGRELSEEPGQAGTRPVPKLESAGQEPLGTQLATQAGGILTRARESLAPFPGLMSQGHLGQCPSWPLRLGYGFRRAGGGLCSSVD